LKIFRKEKEPFVWKEFGFYLPCIETGEEQHNSWDEKERIYGVEMHTGIKLTKSDGSMRFEVFLLGFGFYYCSQWNY